MKNTYARSLALLLAALTGATAFAGTSSAIDPYTGINVQELRAAMAKPAQAPVAAPAVASAPVQAEAMKTVAPVKANAVDPYTGINVQELRAAMGRPAK